MFNLDWSVTQSYLLAEGRDRNRKMNMNNGIFVIAVALALLGIGIVMCAYKRRKQDDSPLSSDDSCERIPTSITTKSPRIKRDSYTMPRRGKRLPVGKTTSSSNVEMKSKRRTPYTAEIARIHGRCNERHFAESRANKPFHYVEGTQEPCKTYYGIDSPITEAFSNKQHRKLSRQATLYYEESRVLPLPTSNAIYDFKTIDNPDIILKASDLIKKVDSPKPSCSYSIDYNIDYNQEQFEDSIVIESEIHENKEKNENP